MLRSIFCFIVSAFLINGAAWSATPLCSAANLCSAINNTTCDRICAIAPTYLGVESGYYQYQTVCPAGYASGNTKLANTSTTAYLYPTSQSSMFNYVTSYGYSCVRAYWVTTIQTYTTYANGMQDVYPTSGQSYAMEVTNSFPQTVCSTTNCYKVVCCPGGTICYYSMAACGGVTTAGPYYTSYPYYPCGGWDVTCGPTGPQNWGACCGYTTAYYTQGYVYTCKPPVVPLGGTGSSDVCIYTGPTYTPDTQVTPNCTPQSITAPGEGGTTSGAISTNLCPPTVTPMKLGPGSTLTPSF